MVVVAEWSLDTLLSPDPLLGVYKIVLILPWTLVPFALVCLEERTPSIACVEDTGMRYHTQKPAPQETLEKPLSLRRARGLTQGSMVAIVTGGSSGLQAHF